MRRTIEEMIRSANAMQQHAEAIAIRAREIRGAAERALSLLEREHKPKASTTVESDSVREALRSLGYTLDRIDQLHVSKRTTEQERHKE